MWPSDTSYGTAPKKISEVFNLNERRKKECLELLRFLIKRRFFLERGDMKPKEKKPKIGDLIKSVLAGLFGVQSEESRKRDFKQSSITPYLVVGTIMIGIMIFTLLGIISLVIAQ